MDPAEPPSGSEWAEPGEMLRLLVEAVEDYAIFMLDPEGRVASWNPGAERSKQWTADEIIGKHFRVFYPPEKQAVRHPERELEIALREGRYEEEGWRIRKDGSRFWAHVTITTVRGPDGRLLGFGKVTRDNTALGGKFPAGGGERLAAQGRRGSGTVPGDDHARAAVAGRRAREHREAAA